MNLSLELALDRAFAELATELPAHVRALAMAYAGGKPPPPPLGGARLDLALRALADDDLAPRGLRLLRELTPAAIEDSPAVRAARRSSTSDSSSPGRPPDSSMTAPSPPGPSMTAPSPPDSSMTALPPGSSPPDSWDAFDRLAAARTAVARSLFGRDHVAWIHWLAGAGRTDPAIVDWPADLDGWHAPAPAIPHAFVERAWRDLADRHGARGSCRIVTSTARPRAFVVEPGREVIVVIGELTTPALRFAALHELGHALAALLSPQPLPRVLDEAAASYVSRLLEREGDLDLPWFTPLAAAARDRRVRIAMALDARERGQALALARPPWSLWHDPGAQAVYVVAERFADRWWADLGAAPEPGAFARRLAAEHDHVDRAALADRELEHPMQPRP